MTCRLQRHLCTLIVAICAFVHHSTAVGQSVPPQGIDAYGMGTSSNRSRQQAIAAIPFRELAPAAARKVSAVVQNASIFRQLPITTIQSDPDLYLYLVRYPEVIISTWRLMGVTQMNASRVGAFQLHTTDGVGTSSDVELVYGRPDLNIYYGEGEYNGSMLMRKVKGKCVLVLQSDYRYDAEGNVQVTSRLDVFLKIDNLAASIIAKTVHPLFGTTADHNFVESLRFFQKLSETTLRNGPGVQKMARRLPGLRPDVRNRFIEVAGIAHEREMAKVAARPDTYLSPPKTHTGQTRPPTHSNLDTTSYRMDDR